MKKTLLFISIVAMFISSCSLIENFLPEDPTPVPSTPMPTATPDPCAAENLLEEVEKIQDLVNEFQDSWIAANSTPQVMIILPIMELQAVRRDLQKLDVPVCEEAIKTASLKYMNSTINYLVFFMANPDPTDENLIASQQNGQVLWQVVLEEFNKVLTSAGLVSEELPDIGITAPQTTDSGVIVGNESTQGVNVRGEPNINAGIISRLEPGMQAIGLARNESGDWLLVNLDGVIGWVNTETVTTSAVIEDLPISDPDPIIEE